MTASYAKVEINVTKNGQHFFATAGYSSEASAAEVFLALAARFPEAEGWKVTASRVSTTVEDMTFVAAVVPVALKAVPAPAPLPAPVVPAANAAQANDASLATLKAAAATQPKVATSADVKALYEAGIAKAKAEAKAKAAAQKAAPAPAPKKATLPKSDTKAIPGALVAPATGVWTKADLDHYYAVGMAQAKA